MGAGVELVNFNKLFHQEGRRVKTIINDLPETTEADKERINSLVYLKFDSNSLLSNLPSCECGECTGEYMLGVECPYCFSLVVNPLEEKLEPLVWVRAPKGVLGIPNPVVWTMLTKKFSPNGFDLIRWFAETTYSEPDREPPELDTIKTWMMTAPNAKGGTGIDRGLNEFIRNFDTIFDYLYTLKRYRVRKGQEDELYTLIRTQRDCVFSEYLPLPNRALLVIEKNNMGNYVDPMINGILDGIRTISSIDVPSKSYQVWVKENRIVKMTVLNSKYFNDMYAKKLAMKEGIFRKHIFGTRSHWSFRAVISSKTDWHSYKELDISWGVAVTSLQVHLKNKLLRMGMTVNEASGFLYEHTQKYHPTLDRLFQELIKESPDGKGLVVAFQRNPSLERGSAQMFYVNYIKGMFNRPELVRDPTVGLPILDVKGLTQWPLLFVRTIANFFNCWDNSLSRSATA